ncbi:aldehyde dehydrogenase family protein [Mesorhizobium sp.]|uniref:aldehyde dehydrogenase family protein n=1 Tax=Mesorhizobium sp. TaxID=1871066 RepID=UPI00269953F9
MKHTNIPNLPTHLYIGGQWRDASDGATFGVTNPATAQLIANVSSATPEDGLAALDAAQAAFADWAGRKPRERAEILRTAFALIMEQKEEFARLITIENGKALPDSRAKIAYAAEFFRWNSEEAVRNIGEVSRGPSSGRAFSYIISPRASRCW